MIISTIKEEATFVFLYLFPLLLTVFTLVGLLLVHFSFSNCRCFQKNYKL